MCPCYARHDFIVTILYLHTHTHIIIAINTRLYVLFYSNTCWNPGFRGIMHLHKKKKENLRGPQARTGPRFRWISYGVKNDCDPDASFTRTPRMYMIFLHGFRNEGMAQLLCLYGYIDLVLARVSVSQIKRSWVCYIRWSKSRLPTL